jgi:Na+/H+-dicarboxylate symporter
MHKFIKSPITLSLAAMIVGAIVGAIMGKDAGALALLAWLPLTVIKGLATPLLFLAIVSGLMDRHVNGRGVRKLAMVCAVNTTAAVCIAIVLVHFLEPGRFLQGMVASVFSATTHLPAKIGWTDAVKALVPDSITGPFTTNNVPAVLILAILVGVSLRRLGYVSDQAEPWFLSMKGLVHRGMQVVATMMHFILITMPLAIFASVAKAVGENGFSVFHGLAWYVVICIGGMILQILFVYQPWIVLAGKRRLREFWRHARLPATYAFGVNSSLATLPTTLQALDDLKVSPASARLGACVGTNFNNDGILLYEVAAVLMIAQAAGLNWTIAHQFVVAGMCVVAALGVSGFPEAGIVALTLVLSSAGLPLEVLPLLLPVDWLVARMRSTTNVISDMTVSIALERWSTDREPGND